MKIVQFMASEGWGGAESVFVDVSNELAKSHHVIAFLLRGTEYARKFSADVHLVTLQSNPTRYNPFLLSEIFSRLRDIKPDIVHTHAVKGTELICSVNRYLRIPHVGTKHNVRKGKIFNTLNWVTAVSEAAKNSIHSVRTSARIEVIYNGIEPISVAATQKSEVFTILAIGRLDRVKGFKILIEQVRDLTFDFRLLIIGEGPEKDNLEETIRKTGMEGKVCLTGFREDIALLMKSSHVVVISSYSEGFSKVMVEAMFYADAVVSTPVGIAVEVLPAVFIAEQGRLGEKIARLHQNYDNFISEFRKISEKKRKNFLLPHIVEKYNCFYREMSGK